MDMHIEQQSRVLGQVQLDLNRDVEGQGLTPANRETKEVISDLLIDAAVMQTCVTNQNLLGVK